MRPCRTYPAYGDQPMRTLEAVSSILLAIAAQALVVGVFTL